MTAEPLQDPQIAGRASARDAVEAAIARIEAENPRLQAVSALFADAARARADELDRIARAGLAAGPLHGVPVLVKELVDIAGQVTAFGSRCYAAGPAARNAPVIDRLEAAGAIILGTTQMVEFAIGSWGTNVARGTPLNPADPVEPRAPGGSSSGSAVAVAAGMVPLAFGSDTGGSVRIPATLCGVVGYKPSYGLIPMQGVAPTGPTFDVLGPLTRSVAEARIAVEVAAGLSLAAPPCDLAGLVVAHVADAALAPIDPAAQAAYDRTRALFAAAGAHLREMALPLSFVEIQAINGDIVAFEAYRHLGPLAENPAVPLDPFVRARVLQGARLGAADYRARLAEMQALRRTFAAAFRGADVLLLPGTPMAAPRLAEVDEAVIPMSRFTRAANCLGLCAIALPVPATAGALPLGIQLAAPAMEDARLLAIAETVERMSAQG